MGLFHNTLLCSLHGIVLLQCFALATTSSTGTDTDRLALLEFKATLRDPLGAMSSWNDTIPVCQWWGITCNHKHQRVTTLDLHSSKLKGPITPHIGNLSFLRDLQLQNNSLTHHIPPEIGRLGRLQNLFLLNNSLAGEIPSNLSKCADLVWIDVRGNQLVGQIPHELGLLPRLEILSLGTNNLTGSIPFSLGNISSLQVLVLNRNSLSGTIPTSLGQLSNLRYLLLGANKLFGTIPISIFNISSLIGLFVSENHLHGNLPLDFGNTLPNLQLASIALNQITGSIPVSVTNCSYLQLLELDGNNLTGKVPSMEKLQKLQWFTLTTNNLGSGGVDEDLSFISSLANATSLELLAINENNFGGMLPKEISNFSTKLTGFAIDNNQIYGSIPTWIENLVNLQDFEVWNNQLSGTIPPSIGQLKNLVKLSFSKNKFSGPIPSSFGNLTNLITLNLSRNYLQGNIPSSLGRCQKLIELDLSRNNLSGAIPPQIMSLSSLSIYLGLSHNRLSGSLPSEIGNLKNLGKLDVSKNELSGEIPSSLGSCTKLEFLDMNGNLFQGPISSFLKSLRGLQLLDLSQNKFSGEIPEFLTDFDSLRYLNLSYNNFEGMVPTKGVFTNVSASTIKGNSLLCGGIPEFQLPVCKSTKKRRFTTRLKVIISTASGLSLITFFVLFLILVWHRRKRKQPVSSYSENSLLKVSYQSLLKATDGFSSANLIGVGSFGSVYKGILDHDNKMVAIKVFNLLNRGASKSFIAECEALRNIRHRNLVKVLTVCSGVDFQGNDFKALVYEYMTNGNLEEWLHSSEAQESPRKLNFVQRLNIAIDVAWALEYLHHQCEMPIIHCDLKPSNVLLDHELCGHIGDFGIAKFLSEGDGHSSSANQWSSIGIRGTIGYAPPEYGMGSETSTFGDVYSYGILLLEMFTGKRPTDDVFKEGMNLHKYAKVALPERVAEITDHLLLQERTESEASTSNAYSRSSARDKRISEFLISIFEIGINCSSESPKERMDINDVVSELYSIRDKFLRIRLPHER